MSQFAELSSRAARAFSHAPAPRALPLVVQKFGGTSLGTPAKLQKVLSIIHQHYDKSNVIAVVSGMRRSPRRSPAALSSDTKAEGTTNRLLAAAEAAVAARDYSAFIDRIEDNHMEVLHTMLKPHAMRDEVRAFSIGPHTDPKVCAYVVKELKTIRMFCEALQVRWCL
jgi:aspartokinase